MKNARALIVLIAALATVLVMSLGVAGPGNPPLYGTMGGGGGGTPSLLLIDPNTGLGSVIGPTGGGIPGLGAKRFTLYGGLGGGGADVVVVNPNNGSNTSLGSSGLGVAAVPALDQASDGTMYASVNIAGDGGTGGDHLATVDLDTGVVTVIGPYGTCTPSPIPLPTDGSGSCTIEGMEAIAFDASGTLYGAVSARTAAGTPGLYTINTTTGAATFQAPILDVAGAPLTGGVVSLQFACNGVLYGGSATALPGGPADGGFLVTINPTTGLFSFVGATSATGGSSLAGLAFFEPCTNAIVPTLNRPGLFALVGLLLALGVLGLMRTNRRRA